MALTSAKTVNLTAQHINFLAPYFNFSSVGQTFEKYTNYKDTFITVIKDITLNEDGSKNIVIAGVCLFRLHQPTYGKGLISYIAVDPAYRGLRLSNKLIIAAEAYMSAHGITESTTNIRHNNVASIASFKSNGYIINRFDSEYNNGNQKYNLVKQL